MHSLSNAGRISLAEAKMFVSRIYSLLLFSIVVVPSLTVRLLLMAGSISTFLYTKHLKPVTLLKNIAVGFICCLAPAVGGFAAVYPAPALSTLGSVGGLTAAVLLGIMHREIHMDIVDTAADAGSGVATIPVRWGKRVAAQVALGLVTVMTALCLARGLGGTGPCAAIKFAVGAVGCGFMWLSALLVLLGEQTDELCSAAIEQSKLTFMLVLASFL